MEMTESQRSLTRFVRLLPDSSTNCAENAQFSVQLQILQMKCTASVIYDRGAKWNMTLELISVAGHFVADDVPFNLRNTSSMKSKK